MGSTQVKSTPIASSRFQTTIYRAVFSFGTCLVWGVALLWTVSARGAGPASGGAPGRNPFEATNSAEARQDAVQSLPWDRLDAASQAKIRGVLSSVTIFRRMPVRVIDCDPDLYVFLVRHPDVVVNIWDVLGVTQLQVRQTNSHTYQITDNAGTNGVAEILYQSGDTHLVYAEGTYQGPLTLRPTHGRCLLALRSGYLREDDGRTYVSTRLDSFVNIDPGAIHLLTRAFESMVGKIGDQNFVQTVGFVGSLSRTAEVNPQGVQRLSGKLEQVSPEVRQQFADLAAQVSRRSAAGIAPLEHPRFPVQRDAHADNAAPLPAAVRVAQQPGTSGQ